MLLCSVYPRECQGKGPVAVRNFSSPEEMGLQPKELGRGFLGWFYIYHRSGKFSGGQQSFPKDCVLVVVAYAFLSPEFLWPESNPLSKPLH